MTTPPKGSRARFLTHKDVVMSANKLRDVLKQLDDVAKEIADAGLQDHQMKIDGGDMIADAVTLATQWYYKVKGAVEVKKVATLMNFKTSPDHPEAVADRPKSRAKR